MKHEIETNEWDADMTNTTLACVFCLHHIHDTVNLQRIAGLRTVNTHKHLNVRNALIARKASILWNAGMIL